LSAAPALLRCRPWLGTFVEVRADTAAAVEAAFAAIETVHGLMSLHRSDSELSRLNRCGVQGPLPLHAWTAAVIARALFWAEASDSAFDPTIGGRMQAAGLIPRHPGEPEPDPQASWRDVRLAGGAAAFARPLRLDLCGIAKGFAADRAVEAMRAAGAERGLVNAGGDLAGFGQAWPLVAAEPRTRRPMARLSLHGGGLATSAVLPGRRGGRHLPRRGRAWISATVAAPTATDADALAKVALAAKAPVGRCLGLVGARALRLGGDGRMERLG
jgi:thiamine biosynthesis lipoprotein